MLSPSADGRRGAGAERVGGAARADDGRRPVDDDWPVQSTGSLAVDAGLVLALPATWQTGLSSGIGAGVTRGRRFAWGVRGSWSTATESSLVWTVSHDDFRLRAVAALQQPAGRGVFALRLGLGPTFVYEHRTRNQGARAGLTGTDLEIVGAGRLSRRRSRGRGHAAHPRALVARAQRRTDRARRGRGAARRVDGAARRGVAAVRRVWAGGVLCLAPLLVAACGRLQGFDGEAPPLASFDVVFHGDLAPLRPAGVTDEHALRVALVWGAQWLTEPFCVLPAESPEVAAVIDAGCRDPFGFVPAVVSVSVPIAVDVPATLTLTQLPAADVMVGDVTARVAYGEPGGVRRSRRLGHAGAVAAVPAAFDGDGRGPPEDRRPESLDIIYGASFVTMTAPDQRVAFREGAFDARSAFYPRAGCDPPPPGFSVLAAGGFTAEAALAALLAGGLPPEDPATCAVSAPAETTIAIAARAPADVQEVGCEERTEDSSVRYREPPPTSPDLESASGRAPTCRRSIRATEAEAQPRISSSSSSRAHLDEPLQGAVALHAARVLRGRELRDAPTGTSRPTRPPGGRAGREAPRADATRRGERRPRCCCSRSRRRRRRRRPARATARARARDAARGSIRPRPRRARRPGRARRRGRARARVKDDEGPPRFSLPTQSDRDAWLRGGFRLSLGLTYGRLVGLEGAPSGRLLGPTVRVGLRLDADWSLFASFQYNGADDPGGLSALRFAGTIDPTWHATRHLSLALGLGFGGIVEGVSGRPDVDPLPGRDRDLVHVPQTRRRRCRAAAASAWRVWRARSGRSCSDRARRRASAWRCSGSGPPASTTPGASSPTAGRRSCGASTGRTPAPRARGASRGAEARRAGVRGAGARDRGAAGRPARAPGMRRPAPRRATQELPTRAPTPAPPTPARDAGRRATRGAATADARAVFEPPRALTDTAGSLPGRRARRSTSRSR